jgi:hypothetical protein
MGTGPEPLYGAQTLAGIGPVHGPGGYRGVFSSGEVGMANSRSKDARRRLRLEAARLSKSHLHEGWTPRNIDACERLANQYLGHTNGCRSSEFRTKLSDMEIPASHLDFNVLSPITYLIP